MITRSSVLATQLLSSLWLHLRAIVSLCVRIRKHTESGRAKLVVVEPRIRIVRLFSRISRMSSSSSATRTADCLTAASSRILLDCEHLSRSNAHSSYDSLRQFKRAAKVYLPVCMPAACLPSYLPKARKTAMLVPQGRRVCVWLMSRQSHLE